MMYAQSCSAQHGAPSLSSMIVNVGMVHFNRSRARRTSVELSDCQIVLLFVMFALSDSLNGPLSSYWYVIGPQGRENQ
jgi:hypothetical protein